MEPGLAELGAVVRQRVRSVCADGQGTVAARLSRIPLLGDAAGTRPQIPFRNDLAGRCQTVTAPSRVQSRGHTRTVAGVWAGCSPTGPKLQTPL
jgi:hypothetical protein